VGFFSGKVLVDVMNIYVSKLVHNKYVNVTSLTLLELLIF